MGIYPSRQLSIIFILNYFHPFSDVLLAQSKQSDHSPFTLLNTHQGLSNNYISDIIQDKRGFIWISTQYGVNRYDGKEFKLYHHEPGNPHSLGANWVYFTYEDSKGNLWMGTHAGGISHLNTQTEEISHYRYHPNDPQSISGDHLSIACICAFGKVFRMASLSFPAPQQSSTTCSRESWLLN
ncbi:MAG: two-component regulator propeller domain-containing protein, partial [Bacteroidota bacterium]